MTVLSLLEHMDDVPDVIALGGWTKAIPGSVVGAGYSGATETLERTATLLGREVKLFTSSHERSHIMMAVGMAPAEIRNAPLKAVLVWEGALGRFYLLDENASIVKEVSVLSQPGTKYILLFRIADPTFPDEGGFPTAVEAGKLMALAAYGNANDADAEIAATVEQILELPNVMIGAKKYFKESPVYNAGIESAGHKTAAALLTERIFEIFADGSPGASASRHPALHLRRLRAELRLEHEVARTWAFFVRLRAPLPKRLRLRPRHRDRRARCIDRRSARSNGTCTAASSSSGTASPTRRSGRGERWISAAAGRCARPRASRRVGPGALGDRSARAGEPITPGGAFQPTNARPSQRDQACVRITAPSLPAVGSRTLGRSSTRVSRIRTCCTSALQPEHGLGAITHVDGSARPQTVTKETNARLYDLLSAFAAVTASACSATRHSTSRARASSTGCRSLRGTAKREAFPRWSSATSGSAALASLAARRGPRQRLPDGL